MTSNWRAARAAALVAIGAGALLTGAPPAAGDCCLGPADAPSPNIFHIRFGEPVPLRPVIGGEVSSAVEARYKARATILIGGAIGSPALRPILRLAPVAGTSAERWSPLRLRLSLAQCRRVRRIAHREHRRPVLAVQVKAVPPDRGRVGTHAREFIVRTR